MSSSESSFSDIENSSSDIEWEEDNCGLSPYAHEPTFSNKSYMYTSDSSSRDSNDSDVHEETEVEMKRIGNIGWCKCGRCKVMSTEKESFCCKEVMEIDEGRLEGKACISLTAEFEHVCLNQAVVKTALVAYNDFRRGVIKGTFDNKNMRFGCYKQYTYWIHNKLGKAIPSCIIWSIRDKYPESTGNYVPFEDND